MYQLWSKFGNISIEPKTEKPEVSIVTIQKWVRGHLVRVRRLPTVLYSVSRFLKNESISFSKENADGRINSCMDESTVIKILSSKFKINIPKSRMWYDLLIYDYRYSWIPVNIKSTTMSTSDNTGNLAMCVYAYTDTFLDLNTQYDSGEMSIVLINALQNKKWNTSFKKDYFFIVLNKNNKDIIINSVKGLTTLTPNINNLPFQVCWDRNTIFKYKPIKEVILLFLKALQTPRPSWKELFMKSVRAIPLE